MSPQLSWVNPPAGTKSFVLLMVDPEGRGGAGVNHWVAYGIPADVTGFAEGEVSKPSDKYVGGKSTQGVGFYSGPCTPPAVQPHHYTFVLVATDFEPKELPPGLTKDEVTAKIVPAGTPAARQGLGRHRRPVREAELTCATALRSSAEVGCFRLRPVP